MAGACKSNGKCVMRWEYRECECVAAQIENEFIELKTKEKLTFSCVVYR